MKSPNLEKDEVDYMLEAVERKHYKSAKKKLKFIKRKTSADLIELKLQVCLAKLVRIYTRFITSLIRYYEVSGEFGAILKEIISELEKDRENVICLLGKIKDYKRELGYTIIVSDICDDIMLKRSALVRYYEIIKDISDKAVKGIEYIPAQQINNNIVCYNEEINELMLRAKGYIPSTK